jgi:hypothetical protein
MTFPVTLGDDGFMSLVKADRSTPERASPTRFYHINVENLNREASLAHNVRVYVTRIEVFGESSGYESIPGIGYVPLLWRHEPDFRNILGQTNFSIGSPLQCTLCAIVKNNPETGKSELKLYQWFTPNTQTPLGERRYPWNSAIKLRIATVARSDETESEECQFIVTWDGEWADEPNEMAQHLKVEMLGSSHSVKGLTKLVLLSILF